MTLTAWAQTHKPEAAIGAVAGVAGIALYMRSRAAANAAAGGTAPASSALTGSSPAAQSYGYDSSSLDQYNQLSSAISNQNDQIDSLAAQLSSLAAGTAAPAPSPVAPSTPPPVAAAPAPKPAAATKPGIPGWELIATPAQGSAYYAAGKTIDYLPGGMGPSASNLLPFASGGKVLAHPAPGGSEWLKTS